MIDSIANLHSLFAKNQLATRWCHWLTVLFGGCRIGPWTLEVAPCDLMLPQVKVLEDQSVNWQLSGLSCRWDYVYSVTNMGQNRYTDADLSWLVLSFTFWQHLKVIRTWYRLVTVHTHTHSDVCCPTVRPGRQHHDLISHSVALSQPVLAQS